MSTRRAWLTTGLLLALLPLVGHAPAATTTPNIPAAPADHAPATPASAQPSLPPGVSQDWFTQATKNIQQSEYHFSATADGQLSAPNRAQNLRTLATANGVELTARTDATAWQLTLRLIAWGRPDALTPIAPVAPTAHENRVEYQHGDLTAWYVNTAQGLEQGFTIAARPTLNVQAPNAERFTPNAGPPLVLEIAFSETLHATLSADGQHLTFTDAHGAHILDYGALHVTDATGRALPAQLALREAHRFEIRVDDRGAQYPLTIDPVMTTPAWTVLGNQAGAYLGQRLTTIGDVNGDHFSDVLISAPAYDNGEHDEGIVFIYLGSPVGLGVTPAWTAECDAESANFGLGIAAIGDVNGDGYDDVLIGAPDYRIDIGPEQNAGAAFLWLGGPSGPGNPSGLGPDGRPTNADWYAESHQAWAEFGVTVSPAGDVNGDGYADVLIGSQNYTHGEVSEGAVFLWLGGDFSAGCNGAPPSGLGACGNADLSSPAYNADWYAEGNQDNGRLSSHAGLSTAGDVNGDGFSDILVGAWFYENGQPREGAAFVWLGGDFRLGCRGAPPSGLGDCGTPANADWMAESNQASTNLPGASFGLSVSTAGDVNGDGYSDILIGAFQYNNGATDEGAAFLWLGGPSSPANPTGLGPNGTPANADWMGESNQQSAGFGIPVATAGDVNGDGYSDIIIGSLYYDQTGATFLWYGGPSSPTNPTGLGPNGNPTNAGWTAKGTQVNGEFGWVSTAGDVNGDGFSDVLVGNWFYDNGQPREGAAFLYYGSAAGLAATPATALTSSEEGVNWFGLSVALAGDVNSDGYNDVLVGDPHFNNEAGAAFLFPGTAHGLDGVPAWMASSNQPGAQFGWAVASAGDVNGDGASDVLIGAPGYNGVQRAGGAVVAYYGARTGLPATPSWTAVSADVWGAQVGWAVSSAGDVNGDGFSDILVGAPGYSTARPVAFTGREGAAFVWHGSAIGLPGAPVTTTASAQWWVRGNQFVTSPPGPDFGRAVASAGDVNGDGFSDILVGAQAYSITPGAREGAAFLWNGSATGLPGPSPATPATAGWRALGDQPEAGLGFQVASAGDVTGDGVSDVLISAPRYNHPEASEGVVCAWYGGRAARCAPATLPSGLGPCGTPSTADWLAETNQPHAFFGGALAGVGDVNDDGFSDVAATAPNYPAMPAVGAVFGWHGGQPSPNSATGLGLGPNGTPANAPWVALNLIQAYGFGYSLATAGDVNGDGFSDALVGAPGVLADPGLGQAFLYYGNAGDGLDRIPRQARVSDTALIHLLGKSDSPTSLRLKALGRTPLGRGKVQLEWEIKPLGVPFDLTNIGTGTAMLDTGIPNPNPQIGSAVALNELALIPPLPSPTKMYHWRLRVRGVTGPGGAMSPYFPHSPWLTIQPTSRTEEKLRTP